MAWIAWINVRMFFVKRSIPVPRNHHFTPVRESKNLEFWIAIEKVKASRISPQFIKRIDRLRFVSETDQIRDVQHIVSTKVPIEPYLSLAAKDFSWLVKIF